MQCRRQAYAPVEVYGEDGVVIILKRGVISSVSLSYIMASISVSVL